MIDQFEFDVCSKDFDPECYRAELLRASINVQGDDLCRHFCEVGWRLGLDPTRWFSVSEYLTANSDVSALGVNPFYHYLVAGRIEGRVANETSGEFIEGYKQFRNCTTLENEALHWKKDLASIEVSSEKFFSETLRLEGFRSNTRAVLSFSHDDYTRNAGGVQLCISEEENHLKGLGYRYIHCFPVSPSPMLAKPDMAYFVCGVSVDGRFIGFFPITAIFRALRSLTILCQVVVHSLLGFSPELLVVGLRQLGVRKIYFWAHDFFSICPSWTLLRNRVSYCDGPPVGSSQCEFCYFGSVRAKHVERLRTFFEIFEVEVLAPSEDTAIRFERMASAVDYRVGGVFVLRHVKFDVLKTAPRAFVNRLPRVAFLGHPAYHKGWSDFLTIFKSPLLSGKVEFYHLGLHNLNVGRGLRYVEVNSAVSGGEAMINAVRDNEIDFCFIWSRWPETFGFVATEAVIGGSRVLTRTGSGNVEFFSRNHRVGDVFCNVSEVIEFLSAIDVSGSSIEFPVRADFSRSKFTATVLAGEF